jgi:hypothetical protein
MDGKNHGMGSARRLRGAAAIFLFGAAFSLPPAYRGFAMDSAGKPLFADEFTGGNPELEWLPYPHFNRDNLHGALDPSSPGADPGVGVLDNRKVGGFAALSYANTAEVSDFYLEAWLYTQVAAEDRGPLNGIAFRVDPAGDRFYRLAAHFNAQPSLSLAYVGRDSNHFPVYLAQWKAAELPRGKPNTSGWHRVAVEVRNNELEVYWDCAKLDGGPFKLDRVGSGYIGAYANVTGGPGIAETKLDGLRVWKSR